MPRRHLTTFTALIVFFLPIATLPTPAADPPAKLKTQKIAIRVAYGPGPEIELVQIPAGKLTLPDAAGKPTEHTIKPLWFARYETRWDEYDVFWRMLDLTDDERQAYNRQKRSERERRTTHPYFPPDSGWDADRMQIWESPGHDNFPANCIEFQAARRYCAWLSKHTGHTFRLPTEAEWEYACRAGGPPLKPGPTALADVAWFAGNADNQTHEVGTKAPNAWGLYDMLGNVGEYVIRDPKDEKGLLAGGSYKDDAKHVSSGQREPDTGTWLKNEEQVPPDTSWLNRTVHHIGFRVVMEE